jgi:phage pi2 protein 07
VAVHEAEASILVPEGEYAEALKMVESTSAGFQDRCLGRESKVESGKRLMKRLLHQRKLKEMMPLEMGGQ